jgi:hypothetical protein
MSLIATNGRCRSHAARNAALASSGLSATAAIRAGRQARYSITSSARSIIDGGI